MNELPFAIERRPWPTGRYSKILTLAPNILITPPNSVTVTVSKAGEPYYCFRVKAVNESGSSTSNIACTGPTKRTPFTFYMQWPYNLDLSSRYAYYPLSDVHSMWVYSTDKPHDPDSRTAPRTELRFEQEYSTGTWMWQADVYVPNGTDGTNVMQIKRDDPDGPATDFMLRAYRENGGTFKSYCCNAIKTGIYDTWWNVKVVHNTNNGNIHVYINDELLFSKKDNGPTARHFKNGVYGGNGLSQAMFRGLSYWTVR